MTAGTMAVARGGLAPKPVGWAGVALGAIAWYIALPPLTVRTPVPSLLLALAAVTAGALAVRGEERRLGWGAVAAGMFGGVGAVAATESGVGNLEDVFVWSALIAAMLRFATPLVFGALGGIICERSGVINIGLEGMMLMGCFFGIFGADLTGSWVLGMLIGMASGGVLAVVHALFSIQFRADQVVSGFAMNLLAVGITGYLYVQIYGDDTVDDHPLHPGREQRRLLVGRAIGEARGVAGGESDLPSRRAPDSSRRHAGAERAGQHAAAHRRDRAARRGKRVAARGGRSALLSPSPQSRRVRGLRAGGIHSDYLPALADPPGTYPCGRVDDRDTVYKPGRNPRAGRVIANGRVRGALERVVRRIGNR